MLLDVSLPSEKQFLQQRCFAFVAHPDDAHVGMGIFLQRNLDSRLLSLTSGEASKDVPAERESRLPAFFREGEAERAQGLLPGIQLLAFPRFPDRFLYLHLQEAADLVSECIQESKPDILITHAYEGGHPDHDCCSFLASRAGRQLSIPVWEFPLYSAPPQRRIQRFAGSASHEVLALQPSPGEIRTKEKMFRAHESQRNVLAMFDTFAPELFRRQPAYNYYQPQWTSFFYSPGYGPQRLLGAFEMLDYSQGHNVA